MFLWREGVCFLYIFGFCFNSGLFVLSFFSKEKEDVELDGWGRGKGQGGNGEGKTVIKILYEKYFQLEKKLLSHIFEFSSCLVSHRV